MFSSSNAQSYGQKGGSAKTVKKQRAARANGKRGGRRTKRCLAEHLLHQRISSWQHRFIIKAFDQLFGSEKQEFSEYFGTLNILVNGAPKPPRRMPKRIRFLAKKFTLAARFLLRESPAPKEYVIEYRDQSPDYIAYWERKHPDIPCPPAKHRVYVTRLPMFNVFKKFYAQDPTLTAHDIREAGGGQWSLPRAEAALALIRAAAEK